MSCAWSRRRPLPSAQQTDLRGPGLRVSPDPPPGQHTPLERYLIFHFIETTVLSASFKKPDHSSGFIIKTICLWASPDLIPPP